MTTEELLALPDDTIERWLIRGHLRQKPPEVPDVPEVVRNRHHSAAAAGVAGELVGWVRSLPHPRGGAFLGATVCWRHRPDSVGLIDLAYISPETAAAQPADDDRLVYGLPTLAADVLAPNDTPEAVREKVADLLAAGVAVVWVVDPEQQTVTVFDHDRPPALFGLDQSVPEHPAMPGFAPAVADLFE